MSAKGAIVDLGTNTWHLLVGRFDQAGHIERIYHERRYVFLYSLGKERIGPEPFAKALAAMKHYKTVIDEMGVDIIAANGTEGLRKAENGGDLLRAIQEETGIEVKLIDGEKEAQFTAGGIDIALQMSGINVRSQLIMDIGGGSVELMWRLNGEQQLVGSFPIGLGVMYPRFIAGEYFEAAEILDLRRWLASYLTEFFQLLPSKDRPVLVGAAGTFEILAQISEPDILRQPATTIAVSSLRPLLKKLMTTTIAERRAMPGIDEERLVMMPVAAFLVDYVLDFCNAKQLIVSRYGLKEGALKELLK